MSDGTPIEWTNATWPLVAGCAPASPGCDHCYAARNTSGRLRNLPAYAGLGVGGKFTGEVRMLPERLGWPLAWRKPRMIFVCSQSDLFHPKVSDEFIAAVFAVMAACPQHTFQILTKRSARLRTLLCDECRCGAGHPPGTHFRSKIEWAAAAHSPTYVRGLASGLIHRTAWPLPNVHVGVSVESQEYADRRIPDLLGTPAAVRWISAEPLLGPVDLTRLPFPKWSMSDSQGMVIDAAAGRYGVPDQWQAKAVGLDWVVAGGESGPGSRPMHPDWARSLRDQCAGTPAAFFFKQWGDWTDTEHALRADNDRLILAGTGNSQASRHRKQALGATTMLRLGKRRAGRLLDGRTWDEYPQPPQLGERACRVCGCTETNACCPPCSWSEADLCSACAGGTGILLEETGVGGER